MGKTLKYLDGARYAVLEVLNDSNGFSVLRAEDTEKSPARRVLLRGQKTSAGSASEAQMKTLFAHIESLDPETAITPERYFLEDGKVYTVEPESGVASFEAHHLEAQLSARKLIKLGLRVCSVLKEIHKNGYLFSNFSPKNLVLDGAGEGRLTGIFSLIAFKEMGSNELLKTESLPYLSPERLGYVNEPEGAHSDLFALGVLLYECASGQFLFKRESANKTALEIMGKIPEPLHKRNETIPTYLSYVIQKLLIKDPVKRYRDAHSLEHDLELSLKMLDGVVKPRVFALGKKGESRELNYHIDMVGRKQELSTSLDLLEKANKGICSLLFISAPSGMGKSRLAQEVMRVAKTKDFKCLTAKFSAFEKNVPLSAINRILKELCCELEKLSEKAIEGWQNSIKESLADQGFILKKRLGILEKYLPNFEKKKNIDIDEEEKIFKEGLAKLIMRSSLGDRPYLLFLDDLQWADMTSLEIIKSISQLVIREEKARTLLLAAFRSEEVSSQSFLRTSVLDVYPPEYQVEIEGLGCQECNTLVEALLDETSASVDMLKEYTYELTKGNPFYIYEFLKTAIREKYFRQDEDGEWYFSRSKIRVDDIHSGVISLVKGRIKRLSQESLIVIKAAGVLASSMEISDLLQITYQSIQEKFDDPEQRFYLAIDQLKSENLILGKDPKEFTFFHDRVRESVQGLVSEEEKKYLNQEYGRIIGERILNNPAKFSNKEIFEAAFHMIKGSPEKSIDISKQILLLSGKRAFQVFAYQNAREYFEVASRLLENIDAIILKGSQTEKDEWLSVHERLADSLSFCLEIRSAIDLYRNILEYNDNQESRANIYSKMSDNYLTLFMYAESLDCGIKAMESLGEKWIKSEVYSFLYIKFNLPIFLLRIFLNKLFTKNKKVMDENDELRWKIKITILVSAYYSKPLTAIANLMRNYIPLQRYEDCDLKVLGSVYWGVVLGCIGFPKASSRLFSYGKSYFEKNQSPVNLGFTIFSWGYVRDYPYGAHDEAQPKLRQAKEILTEVGEAFFRYQTYQGYIHYDCYAKGNGYTPEASESFIKLYEKIEFKSTVLACVCRYKLMKGKKDEVLEYIKIINDDCLKTKAKGYKSLDVAYADLGVGELYFLMGDYEKAFPFLSEAALTVAFHMHRAAQVFLTYPLYVITSSRLKKKRLQSLAALAYAWFNVFANVRLFRPQTYAATGEYFYSLGLFRIGEIFYNKAINDGYTLGFKQTVAELEALYADRLSSYNSSKAIMVYKSALEYFNKSAQPLGKERCEKGITEALNRKRSQYPEYYGTDQTRETRSVQIRETLQQGSIYELIMKLGVLTDEKSLYDQALETLLTCSGADHGLILSPEFEVLRTINMSQEKLLSVGYEPMGIDFLFLQKHARTESGDVQVRNESWKISHHSPGASVLVAPLTYGTKVYGYIYLGNHTIPEVFDAKVLSVLNPIISQTSIAVQNFKLLVETQNKAQMEAELAAASAVQEALLTGEQNYPGCEVSTWYKSAQQTGGDWYGHQYIERLQTAFFFVGDVTGHGISAALITAMACGSILTMLEEKEKNGGEEITGSSVLQDIATGINRVFYKTGQKASKLMTMSLVAIHIPTGEASFISAGHHFPIRVDSEGKNKSIKVKSCRRLDFLEDSTFQVKTFQLEKNDKLIIYTDGLIENEGEGGKTIHMRQLCKELTAQDSSRESVDKILAVVDSLWGNEEVEDDTTVMVIRYLGLEEKRGVVKAA